MVLEASVVIPISCLSSTPFPCSSRYSSLLLRRPRLRCQPLPLHRPPPTRLPRLPPLPSLAAHLTSLSMLSPTSLAAHLTSLPMLSPTIALLSALRQHPSHTTLEQFWAAPLRERRGPRRWGEQEVETAERA
jgi:hypothetical protein